MKPEGIGRGTGVFLYLLSPCCATLECKGHFVPRSILVARDNEQPHSCSRKQLLGPASLALQGRKYYLNVE